MMELREKINRKLDHIAEDAGWSHSSVYALVDAILDLPEIKEALAYMKAVDGAHPIFHEIREMLDRGTLADTPPKDA